MVRFYLPLSCPKSDGLESIECILKTFSWIEGFSKSLCYTSVGGHVSCKSVKLLDDADDDDDDTRDNWWTEIRREVRAVKIPGVYILPRSL